ncbi:MAG TPA: DUF2244 domain-containing protein [Kaistiaceae bacterium]|nr:DUF2244 domain-containing protein [Kaistiaceae bacterium]
MSLGNAPDDRRRPFFSARLTPHRSLGGTGFAVLMGFAGLVSLVTGIYFARMGAWPVTGFFGLDLLALYVAFRISYRSGRIAEEVEIDEDLVVFRRFPARGGVREYRFNPRWVRLEVERHEAAGTVRLALVSSGRPVTVGAFLNPPDRDTFATALTAALAAARAGRPG